MKNKYLFINLIKALSNLDDQELRRLAAIISGPDAKKVLLQIINATLEFRNAERKSNSLELKPPIIQNNLSLSESVNRKEDSINIRIKNDNRRRTSDYERDVSKNGWDEFENVKQELLIIFNNRKIYKSTKSVIDEIKESFSIKYEYENFYKRGRRDLLNNFLNDFSKLPVQTRKKMLKDFFQKYDKSDYDTNAYKNLFKILVGDE